jgi:hypothetical protein
VIPQPEALVHQAGAILIKEAPAEVDRVMAGDRRERPVAIQSHPN